MQQHTTDQPTRIYVNLPALTRQLRLEREKRDHERTRLACVMSRHRIAEQAREIHALRGVVADEWVGPS